MPQLTFYGKRIAYKTIWKFEPGMTNVTNLYILAAITDTLPDQINGGMTITDFQFFFTPSTFIWYTPRLSNFEKFGLRLEIFDNVLVILWH